MKSQNLRLHILNLCPAIRKFFGQRFFPNAKETSVKFHSPLGPLKFVFLFLCFTLSSCTSSSKTFVKPSKEIHAQINQVLVFPLRISEFPAELSVIPPHKAKEIRAEFEPFISKELREARFSIIPPENAEPVLASFFQENEVPENMFRGDVTGLRGPEAGGRAGSNQSFLTQKLLQHIKANFSVEAVLISAIEFRMAETYGYWGFWDGAWQPLEDSALLADKPGGAYFSEDDVLLPGIIGPPKNELLAPALSLSSYLINVEDGKTVWWGFGGIKLLETFDGAITPFDALQNSKRNAEAVKLVFRSLKTIEEKRP